MNALIVVIMITVLMALVLAVWFIIRAANK
jgi:hypothetical protein